MQCKCHRYVVLSQPLICVKGIVRGCFVVQVLSENPARWSSEAMIHCLSLSSKEDRGGEEENNRTTHRMFFFFCLSKRRLLRFSFAVSQENSWEREKRNCSLTNMCMALSYMHHFLAATRPAKRQHFHFEEYFICKKMSTSTHGNGFVGRLGVGHGLDSCLRWLKNLRPHKWMLYMQHTRAHMYAARCIYTQLPQTGTCPVHVN